MRDVIKIALALAAMGAALYTLSWCMQQQVVAL